MINPRELRIGNLGYSPTWDKIMTWGPTNPDHPHYSWSCPDDGLILSESQDKIQPIPLTPEWLERLGFHWQKMPDDRIGRIGLARREFTRQHSGFKTMMLISEIKEGKFLEHNSDMIIQHVHQLQNLYFALTGEELKISIP